MRSTLVSSLFLALALLLAAPALAEPTPTPTPTTSVSMTQRWVVFAGNETRLDVAVVQDDLALPDTPVTVERRVNGAWRQVAALTTDAQGTASMAALMLRKPENNVFRARTPDGAGSGPVSLVLRQRDSRVRLTGPTRLKRGSAATLTIAWTTREPKPVNGRVTLQQRREGVWKEIRTLELGRDGVATTRVSPTRDGRYRVVAPSLAWVVGGTSSVLAIDVVPPGTPVVLPSGAPPPRVKLPPQPLAVGQGANPSVSGISDAAWNSMVGRSWHAGCPVGRSGLRLVRVNYWDYAGERRRGEMVVAASVAGKVSRALAAMYAKQLPIRSMYRVDRFGWSSRLGGADDYASMAAGNASAFNCRDVVGRPGVPSPHSYGRAIDINPWENPYHSSGGWVPNSWWVGRTHPRVAWRSRSHPVVSTLSSYGFRWTYGTQDAHHFDVASGAGRIIRIPECEGIVCD